MCIRDSSDTSNGNWDGFVLRYSQCAYLAQMYDAKNIQCIGSNDGRVKVRAIGGVSPFSYLWSNADSTSEITNLSAGTYSVTITDSLGVTATTQITITASPMISNISSINQPVCPTSFDGGALITISGGVPVYTYQWSNGQTSDTLVNASSGWYKVTITDNNLCVIEDSIQFQGVDSIAPIAVASNLNIVLDSLGTATLLASQFGAGSSDACGIDTMWVDTSSFTCNDIGANTVILTVQDNNGFVDYDTAIVTVWDFYPPLVQTKDDTVYLDSNGMAIISFTNVENSSADNCGISSFSLSDSVFYCTDVGTNFVSLYVQDIHMNTGVGIASITVMDTISNNNVYTDTIIACDSLTWINGITYYASNNTAQDTLVNVSGCDSIISLDLTITQTSFTSDVLTSCDSLTWINGVTYYASNNTTQDTLVNVLGCDSIVSLDLTIHSSSTRTDIRTSCDSLYWINGVTYYVSNNSDSLVLQSSNGCDSTVFLDLMITHVDTSVVQDSMRLTAEATNASYQWINCQTGVHIPNETGAIFMINDTGRYAVEITQNGCVDTSDCFSFIHVGMVEADFDNVIIYPNPVTNELHIESIKGKLQNVKILDATGKLVRDVQNNFETVDVSSLAKGWYLSLIHISEPTRPY